MNQFAQAFRGVIAAVIINAATTCQVRTAPDNMPTPTPDNTPSLVGTVWASLPPSGHAFLTEIRQRDQQTDSPPTLKNTAQPKYANLP